MTISSAGAASALAEPAPLRPIEPPHGSLATVHDSAWTVEMAAGIRIFAVDSRPLLRSGLAGIARRAFGTGALPLTDLERAATAVRFLDAEPRALLLGLRSGDDPAALLAQARRISPTVLFVFDRTDPALIRAALAAGADGCMLIERAGVEELRGALEAAEAGVPAIPAELPPLGGRPGGRPLITERCLEVLQALAEGLHDDEIAARLGISVSSVRKHLATAQLRLEARTRTQTVARAARDGLL